MSMKKFLQSSLAAALGTAIYVALVVQVMTNAEKVFGNMKPFLGPVAFLLMFVLSAAVTSSLVFGRPVMMYLDGKKREAIKQLGLTLLWLFIILVLVFAVLIIRK